MDVDKTAQVRWFGEPGTVSRERAEDALEQTFRADASIRNAAVELEYIPPQSANRAAYRIVSARIVSPSGDHVSPSTAMAKVTGALLHHGLVATGLPLQGDD